MNKPIILICLFSVLFYAIGYGQSYSLNTYWDVNNNQLEIGFANPPLESRLRCYWWWLNSMATKESITRDLEEMSAQGYGGASIMDAGSSNYQIARKTPAGPVFMSPAWMELFKHAIKEADRLHIELSINTQSGWNPGGPSITPEFAMKKIVWSEVDVAGGEKINIELPQPEKNLLYKDIMIQAIPQKANAALKNEAIQNWKKKSFNEKIGWKGIYPLQELRNDFPGDGSEIAVRKNQIIDLTNNFHNGKLEWDAPEGNWTILRYGYTCTGARTSTNSDGWEGLSVDHLDPKSFELFSNTVITPLIEAAQSVGKSLRFLQTDSWEMDLVSWTGHFPDEFRKFRGYDIQKYMPVLAGRIVETREETDRFLHDFRKTGGDCISEYHYQLFYNLAHKYGLGIHPESGGPHSAPVDALKVMGISDFPQGEFWAVSNTHRIKDDERLSVRQSACVAHTNGKRFVAAEGPTSIGPQWERSPKDLKGNIDRVFCSGVNRIVWHTYTSSPKEFGLPGNEYFAGTHLNSNVTWWKQSKDFISYLNRCSFLLQQGLFVADVLYYYGDDVPNFVFLKEEIPELHAGYDWDKCSKDIILNKVSFDGKRIVLPDGMSYRLLMLAPEQAIDLNVLRKVEMLVNEGLTVISPRPRAATGLSGFPECDRELNEIAGRLWGNINGKTITEHKVGKGRIIWGQNINDILLGMGIKPDFSFRSNQERTALDYIHRTTRSSEIYFITNKFARKRINDFEYRYLPDLPDRYEQVECNFKVSGKVPELWDPKTGEIKEIFIYREEDGHTIIPLLLEPEGSLFVIFKNAPVNKHITSVQKDGKNWFPGNEFETTEIPSINLLKTENTNTIALLKPGTYNLTWSDGETSKIHAVKEEVPIGFSGNWDVYFDPKWGAPEKITTNELKSWTLFEESGIKYYSGTTRYLKSFSLKAKDLKERQLILDLGNVQEMASVKLNGHQMQVLWCAPFRLDITSFVKPGTNDLEIDVVNLWANRLIGDSKLPETQRLTKTNVTKFNGPDADKYLRLSGLMGPVIIRILNQYTLK